MVNRFEQLLESKRQLVQYIEDLKNLRSTKVAARKATDAAILLKKVNWKIHHFGRTHKTISISRYQVTHAYKY
jgi:hypothetical protein